MEPKFSAITKANYKINKKISKKQFLFQQEEPG